MGKGLLSKLDSWLHGKIYFTTIGWLNAMSQSAKRPTFFLTHPVEARGQEGEPIARRARLGWICVGCPEGKNISDAPSNFSITTLFTTSSCDVDEIISTMKKFWDIDSAGTFTQTTVVDTDQKSALQRAKNSSLMVDMKLAYHGKKTVMEL